MCNIYTYLQFCVSILSIAYNIHTYISTFLSIYRYGAVKTVTLATRGRGAASSSGSLGSAAGLLRVYRVAELLARRGNNNNSNSNSVYTSNLALGQRQHKSPFKLSVSSWRQRPGPPAQPVPVQSPVIAHGWF